MTSFAKTVARRKTRVSSNIYGIAEKLRIALHRTNKYIFAQAIDDATQKTVYSVHTSAFESTGISKSDAAYKAGTELGERIGKKPVVIDRSRFRYMGRIARFVTGLRDAGVRV